MSSEDLKIDPARTALVLIEYQNEFTTEGGKLHGAVKDCIEATGTIENSKKMLEEARKAGVTVVHCPIEFGKDHKEISKTPYGILAGVKEGEAFAKGEWGSVICDDMKPTEDELVVSGKRGLCGFASTNLDFILRQNDVKNILLSGFLTNCCVESTMRSGYELGYNIYTLKDCCAATDKAAQDAVYEYNFGMFSNPITSDVAIKALA
mmetsp:Transcript_45364/g.55043  ORF Transcript_45364/g.55043 Transcript_45364/m.55043 type:complete len:207 (+) Transcript_45364:65-685(+)